MKRLAEKLKSGAGESISEVLVSLLISALSLMILAGMIGASTRIVRRSRSALDTYYSQTNALAARSGNAVGNGTVTFTDDTGRTLHLAGEDSISVTYYAASAGADGDVVAYQVTP